MHLSRGIEAADDLMNLGLKAIQARTLFSLISEWKTHGLPLNFSSPSAGFAVVTSRAAPAPPATTAQPVKTATQTTVPSTPPSTTAPPQANLQKEKAERRHAMEKDFYDILRGNKSPLDAHALNHEQRAGGDRLASAYISFLFHEGCGTIQREPFAAQQIAASHVAWLKSEAESGDVFAQHMLGRFYSVGLGVPKNTTEARALFAVAGRHDHAESNVQLGHSLLSEGTTDRDDVTAAEHFLRATMATNNTEAAFRLGQACLHHWGLPYDLERGLHFVRRAADAGHLEAQLYMAAIHEDEDRVGAPEDEAVVKKYLKMAADQGHPEAQFRYADTLYEECDHEGDCSEAKKYYKLAADQGHSDGLYELGCMYFDQDSPEAFKYFYQAAQQDHTASFYYLGECYGRGLGVAPDPQMAARLYLYAAERGDAEALVAMAECYEEGVGVEEDKVKAKRYYKMASDQHFDEEAWDRMVRLTAEGY